ncbi:hypothetical protein FISHEDRAFT_77775 [Fistulina hepatica ATCC 64428]|nr:hypothetical protein FISHEDRAFT_77775 [Fistulina hepatica ATCC 64428]
MAQMLPPAVPASRIQPQASTSRRLEPSQDSLSTVRAPPEISASFTASPMNLTTSPSAFKGPAHKHAHHLHSIPPREKSTRTLIIDHMLWAHGRTRFAQARAELGMTDRTGGPTALNFVHRRRPENYEEDESALSDGEDTNTLKARAGDPGDPHTDEEDERMQAQDIPLARQLRQRAEGLERVITSMLAQTPPVHPDPDEAPPSPPTFRRLRHQHTLPNGVRLRLALGTMINDLFSREYTIAMGSPHDASRRTPAVPHTLLPPCLDLLSCVCAFVPPSYSSGYILYTTANNYQRPTPTTHAYSLFGAGADPTVVAYRCPQHLHDGCEICADAGKLRPGVGVRGKTNAFGFIRGGSSVSSDYGLGPRTQAHGTLAGGGVTGLNDGVGIGSGLRGQSPPGSILRRPVALENGAANFESKLSRIIPRFLKLSALIAAELGREARVGADVEHDHARDADANEEADENIPFDPLPLPAEQIPPRLRSPYLAMSQASSSVTSGSTTSVRPTPITSSPSSGATPTYPPLRPTREWYLLLSGLLTRAAMEGYVCSGWRGYAAVECLLTVGLGVSVPRSDAIPERLVQDPDDRHAEFDPDDLPTITEAIKILFPSLNSGNGPKGLAEEEYSLEMNERLRRFYDAAPGTDLSTHMEDLAWQYPAEPVERAAVRFCESVAKWRGKPELETYKKKPNASDPAGNMMQSFVHSNPPTPTSAASSLPQDTTSTFGLAGTSSAPFNSTNGPFTSGSMSLPPLPPSKLRKPQVTIDVYFSQPTNLDSLAARAGLKRTLPPDRRMLNPAKRLNTGLGYP